MLMVLMKVLIKELRQSKEELWRANAQVAVANI